MNKDIDRKGGYNMLDKKVLLQITLILCLVTFVSDVFAERGGERNNLLGGLVI